MSHTRTYSPFFPIAYAPTIRVPHTGLSLPWPSLLLVLHLAFKFPNFLVCLSYPLRLANARRPVGMCCHGPHCTIGSTRAFARSHADARRPIGRCRLLPHCTIRPSRAFSRSQRRAHADQLEGAQAGLGAPGAQGIPSSPDSELLYAIASSWLNDTRACFECACILSAQCDTSLATRTQLVTVMRPSGALFLLMPASSRTAQPRSPPMPRFYRCRGHSAPNSVLPPRLLARVCPFELVPSSRSRYR
jgi:hypothetical protein